jgi:hypothetical protein
VTPTPSKNYPPKNLVYKTHQRPMSVTDIVSNHNKKISKNKETNTYEKIYDETI